MKILVVGASGKLARPVIQELDKRGFELRLFSRNVNSDMFFKPFEIVNGDVFNRTDLEKAIKGCEAIHINLSDIDEAKATREITKVAVEEDVKLISTISGCTVAEENRWFPMIDNKFRAEQNLMNSGIPCLIFRASWFFESLELMVRKGKASVIGNQKNPYHWIAAGDYARMVGEAYIQPEIRNKIFYVMGEKPYTMKALLREYCEVTHPGIKKVNSMSPGMLRFIALVSGNKKLREVTDMFGYFEKTKEKGDAQETYNMLGKPETSFEKWLAIKD